MRDIRTLKIRILYYCWPGCGCAGGDAGALAVVRVRWRECGCAGGDAGGCAGALAGVSNIECGFRPFFKVPISRIPSSSFFRPHPMPDL